MEMENEKLRAINLIVRKLDWLFVVHFSLLVSNLQPPRLTTIATIKPNNPRASAKMRIRIIPTTMSF